MKSVILSIVAASASLAFGQTATQATEALLHTQTSFTLVVPAPYAVAAPLFGPLAERTWAGEHWDPKFVSPQPAKDVEGAVFTVKHGPFNSVWVNTAFDLASGHIQYVYFLPDAMVTTIDLQIKAITADSTHVKVVYTRTAVTAEGNEHVAAMTKGDESAGKEWQQAIDHYLANRRANSAQ
jgi:hypothetical protein